MHFSNIYLGISSSDSSEIAKYDIFHKVKVKFLRHGLTVVESGFLLYTPESVCVCVIVCVCESVCEIVRRFLCVCMCEKLVGLSSFKSLSR